jgi:hypothetical protein
MIADGADGPGGDAAGALCSGFGQPPERIGAGEARHGARVGSEADHGGAA